MATVNEKTWGSRLTNAQTLVAQLQTFTRYQALRPSESIAALQALIVVIQTQNTGVATNLNTYASDVALRTAAFATVKKRLAPINSNIKGTFGKTSLEATTIADLVLKIRGEKPVIVKVPQSDGTVIQKKISQAHVSYGSMAINFQSIITYLTSKGATYAPANTDISVRDLEILYNTLTPLNEQVATSYSNLSQARETRLDAYTTLAQSIQLVKESVKSTYGVDSAEYKLIRGLKV